MITRRRFIGASLLAMPALYGMHAMASDASPISNTDLERQLAALERRHGGRLGVAMLDTGNQRLIAHRADERFAMCSTFKALAAAYVLARVDRGEEDLSRRVVYGPEQLVPYSPVTQKHTGEGGLSVGSICEAAVTLSDNTAANLLLDSFGGPQGLTDWLRRAGDPVTRLDRREPTLNENRPGDVRDTTTPLAMLRTLQTLVLGEALSGASRDQLIAWLVSNTTGDQKLRAGLPAGWRVGDKTGSGSNNASNDIAIVWPPNRPPLIVTVYYSGSTADAGQVNALMAEIGNYAAAL
ncbi:class A beta-lactamase [Pseudomonas sp. GD03842]|uniref:class A beta-lactamase n=1 Tax=Pseudomonas sp. GD03842 TaxID=2975385 RepID=UPI002449DD82|nr:class A beta-lactamase [Pseudomonas sp. GD03842]MDH0748644.1 class A beta-lactamase [Pseudomonas sp. GD03842]